MKNVFCFFALCLIILISSCRKDKSEFVGSKTGSVSSNSSSYHPLTKNTQRTYLVINGASTEQYTETMTGLSKVISGKTFYEAVNKYNGKTEQKVYFYEGDGVYKNQAYEPNHNITIELEYLNDREPVGFSWTRNVTDNGTVNSLPARLIGTIKEKNITKVVQGKTYQNVIHTSLELQYDFFSGFETAATYEMYASKGIGIILADSRVTMFGANLTSKTELVSYKIY